jgi:hypothetical protein
MSGNTWLWGQKNGDILFPITPTLIGGMAFGLATPAQVTTNYLQVDTGTKTATAVSGAATLNKMAGVVTSESLTTGAGSTYTLTLTNSDIAAADQVMVNVQLGSSTTGTPQLVNADNSAGQVVVIVKNIHASAAFNGTILISFVQDWLTLPSCLASSKNPTLAVVMVFRHSPRRGAPQPRSLRAPPRLPLCEGARTPHVRLNLS